MCETLIKKKKNPPSTKMTVFVMTAKDQILRSDLQKILSVLGTIQNDISDLKLGQELIKVDQELIKEELGDLKLGQEVDQEGVKEELRDLKMKQEGMKEELRTMKVAAAHHVDILSKQMVGVFGKFGDKMLQLFDQSRWTDSWVTDKVMAIQGPRIRSISWDYEIWVSCIDGSLYHD